MNMNDNKMLIQVTITLSINRIKIITINGIFRSISENKIDLSDRKTQFKEI